MTAYEHKTSAGLVGRAGPFVAVGVLSALFVVRALFKINGVTYYVLFDDAMISMRYARNLAEGHGLVWNVGQPPIEGFSNLLWTLWMAALHLLPVPESKISLLVALTGAGTLAGTVAGARSFASRILPGSEQAGGMAAWLVALYYPLYFWTLRGMEVGLIALLLTWGAALAVGRGGDREFARVGGVALCLGLAVLTRDDALVPAGLIAAFAVLESPPARRGATMATLGAALVAVVAGRALFRIHYFGDALPNTYYLKLGGVPLSARLSRGAVALAHLAQTGLWLPALVAVAAPRRVQHPRAALLGLAAFAAAAGYSVLVGGDAWEELDYANRFVCPVVPLLLATAAAALAAGPADPARAAPYGAAAACAFAVFCARDWLPGSVAQLGTTPGEFLALRAGLAAVAATVLAVPALRPARLAPAGALLLALTASGEAWWVWAKRNAAHLGPDINRTLHGLALRAATAEDAVIAVVPAGNIPYFSHRSTIDLLGKSDPRVAHEPPRVLFHPGHSKWDYQYTVRELQPDVVDELYGASPEDVASMAAWGYVRLSYVLWVKNRDPKVDLREVVDLARGRPHL